MPCTRADYFKGILALSEVLLQSDSNRDQYGLVLKHAIEAVRGTEQERYGNSQREISWFTAVLKSRLAM